MENLTRRIVITGGHLTPALAMIEIFQQHDWEIIYFGRNTAMEGDRRKSVESETIPQLGVKFVALNTGRFRRRYDLVDLISLAKVFIGFFQAFFWLLKLKPHLVLSFGGYLGVPTVIAAWILGIPVVVHEQTSVAGLANKLTGIFADKIALSYPSSQKFYPHRKTALTGNPQQSGSQHTDKSTLQRYVRDFKKAHTVVVMGGNQGSRRLNQAVLADLPQLLSQVNIIHQIGSTGAQDAEWDQALNLKQHLPSNLSNNYLPLRFIPFADMGTVYDLASFVISRCGANTTWELGIWQKPCLLIPLEPTAYDEQLHNAQLLEQAGLGLILRQGQLNPQNLFKQINYLRTNLKNYKLGKDYQKIFTKEGAQNLYQLLLTVLSLKKA